MGTPLISVESSTSPKGPANSVLRDVIDTLGLTSRESVLLQRVCEGLSTKELSASLGIRPATARTHLRSIFMKIQVHSASAAVAVVIGKLIAHADEQRRR